MRAFELVVNLKSAVSGRRQVQMDHKVDRSLFFKGDAVTHAKSLSHLDPTKVDLS